MARIFVVGDSALRERLAAMLTGEGHVVATAADGGEADQWLRREPCDLLVSDVVLPGLSGPDLVARLRQRGSSLPAVLVGSLPDRPVPVRGIAFLRPPVHADELLARVDEGLAGG